MGRMPRRQPGIRPSSVRLQRTIVDNYRFSVARQEGVGGELVFQNVTHRKINGLPIVVRLFANSKHGRRKANRRW